MISCRPADKGAVRNFKVDFEFGLGFNIVNCV